MTHPHAIAKQFKFPLDKTWVNLTDQEQQNVQRAMVAMGGKSVNGVSGYFFNLRMKHNKN